MNEDEGVEEEGEVGEDSLEVKVVNEVGAEDVEVEMVIVNKPDLNNNHSRNKVRLSIIHSTQHSLCRCLINHTTHRIPPRSIHITQTNLTNRQ